MNCHLVVKLCLTLLQPPWTVTCQAPLSMGFPSLKQWSRLPFPSLEDLDLQVESLSPSLVGGFFTTEPPGKPK